MRAFPPGSRNSHCLPSPSHPPACSSLPAAADFNLYLGRSPSAASPGTRAIKVIAAWWGITSTASWTGNQSSRIKPLLAVNRATGAMSGTEFQFTYLSDQRLAAHALGPTPALPWRTDAQPRPWANPIAAAVFDAASPGALAAVSFEPEHPAAAQIARLAGTLPQGGAARLERLRGFGAGFGGTLICLCSRIALADNSPAVLVVSTERAGKDLSLPDRAQRPRRRRHRGLARHHAPPRRRCDGDAARGIRRAREGREHRCGCGSCASGVHCPQ